MPLKAYLGWECLLLVEDNPGVENLVRQLGSRGEIVLQFKWAILVDDFVAIVFLR